MKQPVTRQMRVRRWTAVAVVALGAVAGTSIGLSLPMAQAEPKKFELVEATIEDVHAEYKAGRLTARALVRAYLDRIEAYDKNGPKINSVITINPKALEEADALDAAYKRSGPVGPLHGIPVVLKDQMDVAGMPTTLGSVVFKDDVPTRDAFVTEKLKKAGAIVIAKVTLGEMGGGDSYGSLYGVSRNPYDPERTVGGSSGGTGAAVAANFATIGVGQEGFASIRRPSTWNSIVGMRPTPGLVSRTGVWAGWPSRRGSLGPMTRTVTDMAKLLDVMVGYDPDDPVTALGVGHVPETYTDVRSTRTASRARASASCASRWATRPSRTPRTSRPSRRCSTRRSRELKAAGAVVVDPIVDPAAQRAAGAPRRRRWRRRRRRRGGLLRAAPEPEVQDDGGGPQLARLRQGDAAPVGRADGRDRACPKPSARDELMIEMMKVMADNQLDAIVHKSVEHTPTLIKDGINPPYVNQKGAPHLNTFLIYAASMAVPAGFTPQGLPVGITFFGRPYSEPTMIKFAYAYEQATNHRRPPASHAAAAVGAPRASRK